MVTHRMKVAQQSDDVYILEKGVVTKEGELRELKSIFETV
jgi:ABC-type transport system involved in cytochrome bd biosynthesis fused ATPase/permease subunit